MGAYIYVNNEVVDAYKGDNFWSGTFDATKIPGFEVDYEYEAGYGKYELIVRMSNANEKEEQDYRIDEDDNIVHNNLKGKINKQRKVYIKFTDFFENPTIVTVVVKMESY
nr:host range factor 1 protein [Hyphantria cunea nucleopolyhedrovirus]